MSANAPPVLKVEGLTVRYGGAPALDGISFTVEPGDYVGMVGPNGSGKTTLIRAILGLVPADAGKIELFGQPGARFRDWGRIGFLPQAAAPAAVRFPATVEEVVASGRLALRRRPWSRSAGEREAIERAMATAGIADLRHARIGELSGGQRQRAFLARAFVSEPDLLVLDEPTVALDPIHRESFYRVVRDMNRTHGVAVMLVTHDSATIGHHATKLLYLDRRLIFFGSFDDFCRSADMTARFGEFQQHLICHRHSDACDGACAGGGTAT